ncbi:MAG: [FeFe] hydrogenase H-cluster radical SAM maturase HydE [Bacteroidetes bacterium]|nr:[FeFe] hydrogenase H-cluster radical SAM maturase HydE [Bacteroidota bacterium]
MIQKILNRKILSKEEIITLLRAQDRNDIQAIYTKADQVRKKYCGDEVHLRGIIEFSNYCEQNCLYCGLRKFNTSLTRYRMTEEEILQTARTIYEAGIKTIVLQSGEDFDFSGEDITQIIKSIKKEFDIAITLSLGERDFAEYKIWREAGADRYLLKHETANPKLYSTYHLGQKLYDRVEHLHYLKSLGYQIGSGNLIGLPNQSIEDIADDIILCRDLDVDMASFSPFIPSPMTPYQNQEQADVDYVLKVIAVARIVLKNVHIPATTALATIDSNGREKGLMAGANVIMPNFTPSTYRNHYAIYPNKKVVENPMPSLLNTLFIAGRKIAEGQGHSLKNI